MSVEVNESLGERVRSLRLAAGLSQTGLVEAVAALGRAKVKLTPSYLSRIESGERYPSARVVDALATVLEVQPSLLERGVNTWTGVFSDGRLASTSAATPGDAIEKLRRAGELVVLFPGTPVHAWRAAT